MAMNLYFNLAFDKTDEDFDVFRDLNNVDLDFSSQNQHKLQRY